MTPFTHLDGRAAPLAMANVDTDQIIPKQFLKTIEREGLAKGLFYDLRFDGDGNLKPDFVLNQAAYAGTSVLIAGDNFGCGSSREHAPWALLDFGLRCVIAPSFADIFYNNCFENGLLPVALPEDAVKALMDEAKGGNHMVSVDLQAQTVVSPSGRTFSFEIDPGRKEKLLKGLDAVGETLQHAGDIGVYEERRKLMRPWLEPPRMTLIVAGTFRVPPENVEPLRPHMVAVMEATRQEEGCLVYSYGEDVGDPGLIRVYEVWRDQACLDAHFASAHMKQWQTDRAAFGLHDRRISAYEVSGERQL